MTGKIATSSETQLANLSGVNRQSIEGILRAAGIVPTSEDVRKTGTFRLWPRAEALKALRASESSTVKGLKDETAAALAEIIEIELELKEGKRIHAQEYRRRIDVYMAKAYQAIKIMPARYASELADINKLNLPEQERRAKVRELLEPTLAEIRSLRVTTSCPTP
jgi:hypothetical protein